jgi:O-antigen ligase
MMLLPVVAGALAVGAVWIPKYSPPNHARVDVGGAVLSTVGLGGLGLGLTSLTNGSGLNLWVLVTLIVGLVGLAGLMVTERRLDDNAMLPPSLFASRSVVGMAMAVAAVACGLATLAVSIIEPGPMSTSSRETDPFGVRNQQASRPGRNNKERRPTIGKGESL